MIASTSRPVTSSRRQARPATSRRMPTTPVNTWPATLRPVGRNAAMIRARPPSTSQMPVKMAISLSERSGQIRTASPRATANAPVTSSVHQGNGCVRSSVAVPGHGSVSVIRPGWVTPGPAGITRSG
ncbi:hypothetical protein Q0Z83_019850 [Actinoplanes sichuanensis]|nr:hypothetical protein Q0Z83_019850 [Actinoplanes sichuanensis]